MDEGRQQTKRWIEVEVPDEWTLDQATEWACEWWMQGEEKPDVRLMKQGEALGETVCVVRFPAVP
jgi:hypothetical protein